MKSRFLVTTASALLGAAVLAGCTSMDDGAPVQSASAIPEGTGIFAQESTLPFHAPDFTKIRDTDY